MTYTKCIVMTAALMAAGPSFADGDIENGQKLFRNCKACHQVLNGDERLVRGGRAGPNLYGIIGRPAAALEDYSYSPGLNEARDAGLVWTLENFTGFVTNPNVFLPEVTGLDLNSKMPFALPEGAEDIAAYLASLSGE